MIDHDYTGDEAGRPAWNRSVAAHDALAARPGVRFTADEDVVILLHPGFDTLDAVGPHYFLASMIGARVHLATTGAAGEPVISAGGLPLIPTTTLAAAPPAPTVLLIPGGDTGVLLADNAAVAAIERLGNAADTVASVCTGAIALGAAGLLTGRRATSHWSSPARRLRRHTRRRPCICRRKRRHCGRSDRRHGPRAAPGGPAPRRRLRPLPRTRCRIRPAATLWHRHPDTAGPELTTLARDFYAPIEHALRAPEQLHD